MSPPDDMLGRRHHRQAWIALAALAGLVRALRWRLIDWTSGPRGW